MVRGQRSEVRVYLQFGSLGVDPLSAAASLEFLLVGALEGGGGRGRRGRKGRGRGRQVASSCERRRLQNQLRGFWEKKRLDRK